MHFTTRLFTVVLFFSAFSGLAQRLPSKSLPSIEPDSSNVSENKNDTTNVFLLKTSKNALKAQVNYRAKDSIRFDVKAKKVFLFGEAFVEYQDITLKADFIEIDWAASTLKANGVPDSTGKEQGTPVFTQGGQTFQSRYIAYNFKSQRGRIEEVYTKEGEGFLLGEKVLRTPDNEFYVRGGRYTTCNDPLHPHFYIKSNKIKVIPEDKIITGPALLYIEDLPTPLAVPFGFFPNTTRNKSGIIFPTYGESPELGVFLTRGGYFFSINDHWQASLTGDIYSRGSWGLQASTNYNYRYRFEGLLDVRYARILRGDPELLGALINRDFFITWRHNQAAKARPNSQFSANVQAGSNDYNALNSFNTGSIVTNTFQSNVTYTQIIPNTPFSINLNAGHSQNTQTRIISVTAPQVQVNMNRIFPFKSKNSFGAGKWYEKIGVTYTLNGRNTISLADSLFGQPGWQNNFRNGLQHTIPIATSMQVLKYFTFTPSVNITGRGYFDRLEKVFDPNTGSFINDTLRGFWAPHEYSLNAGLNTRVFSTLRLGKNIVRHVAVPTLGFTFQPDYDSRRFGFFGPDNNFGSYSPYDLGIFGAPSVGRRGIVSLAVNNNIEAKLKNRRDTTGTGLKKVTIIEAFNFAGGYNLAADSMQIQPLNINVRTKLFQFLDMVYNGSFDFYSIDPNTFQRVNRLEIAENGRLVRATVHQLALTGALASATGSGGSANSGGNPFANIYDQYVDFNIPYSLNATFNLQYNPNPQQSRANAVVNLSGDLNLTQKWKIGFLSGYDFTNKEVAFTSLDIVRDLHCWELRMNYIPIGFRRSYNLSIKVKASVLSDLKYNRRRNWFDQQNL